MEKDEISLMLLMENLGYNEPKIIDMINDFNGRLQIQKIVQICLVGGVDLGFSFSWYKRGPYSPSLTQTYYRLLDSFSKGDHEYKNYKLWDSAIDSLKKIKPLLINKLTDKELSETEWLELVSSLLFWYKIYSDLDIATQKVEELKTQFKSNIPFVKNEISTFLFN